MFALSPCTLLFGRATLALRLVGCLVMSWLAANFCPWSGGTRSDSGFDGGAGAAAAGAAAAAAAAAAGAGAILLGAGRRCTVLVAGECC